MKGRGAHGVQMLTYGVYGKDRLQHFLKNDPELVSFLVGFWLRFDPGAT